MKDQVVYLEEILLNLRKILKKFDIVFMSNVNYLLLSIALKFETTVSLGIPSDFRVYNNTF